MYQLIHHSLKSGIRKLQARYFIKIGGMVSLAFSPAFTAVFEHFGGHGVVELPDQLDRAFAFVAHIIGLAEVGEGKSEIVLPLFIS